MEDESQIYLPIITSEDKELVNLLIQHSHTEEQPQALQGCLTYVMHFSPGRTFQRTLRGPYGVHIVQAWLRVNTYVASCAPCDKNNRKKMCQEPGQIVQGVDRLGLPYSRVALDVVPFKC